MNPLENSTGVLEKRMGKVKLEGRVIFYNICKVFSIFYNISEHLDINLIIGMPGWLSG